MIARLTLGVLAVGLVIVAFVAGQWYEAQTFVICDSMGENIADVANHEYPVYRMTCGGERTVLYVD